MQRGIYDETRGLVMENPLALSASSRRCPARWGTSTPTRISVPDFVSLDVNLAVF